MEVTTNYISCACNYYPHAVDWGKNGLICYASSHSVIIYDPYAGRDPGPCIGRILETLDKHSSPIKSVQWIKTAGVEPETEIVSGSLDGTIVLWTQNDYNSYEANCIIETKDQLILTQAYYINESDNQSLLICGAFSHDNIFIWRRDISGDIVDKQELNLNNKFPINIKFFCLPTPSCSNIPALIVTTDDNMIQLFAWNKYSDTSEINFVHVKELKGHQDWIQALDVIQINEKESFIASGSQDGMIRLWKCSLNESEELFDEMTTQFSIGNYHFNISLESVFKGHGDWVYGLHWHPPLLDKNGEIYRPLKLLSCGLDKTLVIWKEGIARAWVEAVKLGNIGGNYAGYYGCRFNEDGSSVLAYGYQGSFHIWEIGMIEGKEEKWLPRSAPSGHFSEVNDLAWEAQGRYLMTVSLDQTTRIHVPWKIRSGYDQIWHEISRPQIHGYDINVLAILSTTKFASGADEKVVRIFEAPAHFVEALKTGNWEDFKKIKDRTSVPALGLTNKVVDYGEMSEEFHNEDINLDIPPTEDEIIKYTLWPELEKLYGHGYEIFAMAATHDGKFLATSCKSNSQEHAAIIIWDMKTFTQVQKLVCHRLTITQLEFSLNDEYLISVSRDRGWGLYHLSDEVANYRLIAKSSGANSLHSRIIWCCSWTHDSKYFATGSRDGKIGFWNANEFKTDNNKGPTSNLEINNASVTALAFSKKFLVSNTYILAIGYDDGGIEIQKIIDNSSNFEFIRCGKLEKPIGHHKTVKRLAFRPQKGTETLQLASCSSDWAVKIYTLYSENLKNIVK